MSAPTDASGTIKYWFNGLPFEGVNKTGNDNGTMKFWFNGLPGEPLFAPATTSTTSRITLMGVGT